LNKVAKKCPKGLISLYFLLSHLFIAAKLPVLIAVAVAANIGYATPISTPPITMTLVAGYRFMDYVKFGGLFNVMAYLLVVFLFPLVLNV